MAKRDEIRVSLRPAAMKMAAELADRLAVAAQVPLEGAQVLAWLQTLAKKMNGKPVRVDRRLAAEIVDQIHAFVAACDERRLAVVDESGDLYVAGVRVAGLESMPIPDGFGEELDNLRLRQPETPVDGFAALAEIALALDKALQRKRGRQRVTLTPPEIAEFHENNKARDRADWCYSEVWSGHREKPEKLGTPPLRADTAEQLGVSERTVESALPEGREILKEMREASPPSGAPEGAKLAVRFYIDREND
ncbi:MAG: hypothetical protein AB7V13_30675 [Pseudorhodoplanes sp.]